MTKSDGQRCLHYTDLIEPTPLFKISRRTARLAAGMFSATLGLTSVVVGNANSNVTHRSDLSYIDPRRADDPPQAGNGKFEGLIYAPNGTVIRYATVHITNSATKEVVSTITDWNGMYKFTALTAGIYTLRVEAEGYGSVEVPNLVLRAGDSNRLDQTLSIASPDTGRERAASVRMAVGRVTRPKEPLVLAAQFDDLDDVKDLLRTTDANRRDSATNMTALEWAVRNANREMVQVLLWAKANVKAKDRDGQTVLMMIGPQATSDLVWDLVNAGAKVNDTDNEGNTALIESARLDNTEVMKALLDAGANVNAVNKAGQSALIVAASEGFTNGVHMLIQAGAEIDHRDKEGKSALAKARANDNRAVIRLLVSCNAVDFEDRSIALKEGPRF